MRHSRSGARLAHKPAGAWVQARACAPTCGGARQTRAHKHKPLQGGRRRSATARATAARAPQNADSRSHGRCTPVQQRAGPRACGSARVTSGLCAGGGGARAHLARATCGCGASCARPSPPRGSGSTRAATINAAAARVAGSTLLPLSFSIFIVTQCSYNHIFFVGHPVTSPKVSQGPCPLQEAGRVDCGGGSGGGGGESRGPG